MIQKKWIVAEDPPPDQVAHLAAKLGVSLLVAKILLQRDTGAPEQANLFLNPQLTDLTEPTIFPDMEKAIDRIISAINGSHHIMIHGDYDVDGVTSTSLLYLTLQKLGAVVSYYIPNRLSSGYGLSETSVGAAVHRGCKLLITVDCGITAAKEIDLANQMGIDTIVTDHHEFQNVDIAAYAVINPKALPPDNPAYFLAGVGVAFKLVQGVYYRLGYKLSDLIPYLDLVAMGTVADLVPLINENRVLSRFGIKQLANCVNPGLQALLDVTGLRRRQLTTGQLVFVIAPRINAVGRLGDAQLAVRLFTTKNPQQALNIARTLEEKNRRRRSIDEETFQDAYRIIEQDVDVENVSVIVLASENWHQGVIGIVASRIVEKYHRPTVMISIDPKKKIGKGSARSVEGFHLFNALKQCEEYMDGFGGHKYAAGLTIHPDKINLFREALEKVAGAYFSTEDTTPKLRIDCEINPDEIDDHLMKNMKKLAPFGPENMRPVLLSKGMNIVGSPTVVGNNHLKFRVRKQNLTHEAIAYRMADQYYDQLQFERPRLNLAYVLDENEWRGRKTIQLRIKGIKFYDDF
ncbi:MAG: single-stranded-DNA-specific exonuclease RecJ [Candidatus Cloacimonetes bacterium 4572_55]|nr:MAG: single-stranded-DNA-specific exonuclease RecJ [Candidatus Cloacimonetes bacterium 4572_55]